MNIFVSNINFKTNEDSLRDLFEEFGKVTSAKIITDRESGRSKGYGFIEMSNDDEAQEAIDSLNGKEIDGRKLVVNESRPKK